MICDKTPYAGCMTAPCNLTPAGDAECSCPIFWGVLQLFGDGARCSLSDDLVNSASYDPAPDVLPTPSPTPSPAPWSCYELDTPAGAHSVLFGRSVSSNGERLRRFT